MDTLARGKATQLVPLSQDSFYRRKLGKDCKTCLEPPFLAFKYFLEKLLLTEYIIHHLGLVTQSTFLTKVVSNDVLFCIPYLFINDHKAHWIILYFSVVISNKWWIHVFIEGQWCCSAQWVLQVLLRKVSCLTLSSISFATERVSPLNNSQFKQTLQLPLNIHF